MRSEPVLINPKNSDMFDLNKKSNASGCMLCPRKCGADRKNNIGFCGIDDGIYLAKAYIHRFEEPPISGGGGSGTVFFSGCNLKCRFCQNYEISHSRFGKKVSVDRLAEIFEELQTKGAENINLVTPTPYVDKIIEALEKAHLSVPVVYNCGGYENPETIGRLKGYIDIFMPDVKFFSDAAAVKYCSAPDYFEISLSALETMVGSVGKPVFGENGMLKSGVIVRHLVMPTLYRDSVNILQKLFERFGNDSFLLSIMSQYTPVGDLKNLDEINRKITTFEYEKVVDAAVRLGFNGYTQERSSANSSYTPAFDLSGV